MGWVIKFRQLAIAALLGMFVYIATSERAAATIITCTGDVSIEGVSASACWTDDAGFPMGDTAETAFVNLAFGATDFILLAKSDAAGSGITDSGGNPGTFAIEVSLLDGIDSLALAFKTGCGQNVPCSAVFGIWDVSLLDPTNIGPNDEYNGIFDLTSWGQNDLSYISVYGVPEPGTLGLIGSALLALGLATRRRRRDIT